MQRGTLVSLGPDRVPVIDPSAFVATTSTVAGAVRIGPHASVWYGAVLRAEFALIDLGAGSNLQDNVVVHVDEGFPTTIGRDVSVGHNAVIHGATIGDGALIGMNATVLNGAVIGAGSLVAAGTVVLEGTVVPEGSLVAGVPGKVRRALTEDERASIAGNARRYRDIAAMHAEA